eukprot:TRINITY_DN4256_c0_g2_i1.p1 TRINITY_DN4256_c0_g2~~TRINITY_DN4256_c0_g2_i1.p1  ORF type:complete len:564 (+),score=112.72 TRINITY_DN4256_c0_g2_i1:44-1693(+)
MANGLRLLVLASIFLLCSCDHSDISSRQFPTFEEPTALYSEDGYLSVTLVVNVGRVSNGPYQFNARMYNSSYPGPTLYLKPGDHLTLTVINDLGDQNYTDYDTNSIHDLNSTGMHVHGLHIPSTSDNAFITIEPGDNFTYEYDIIDDHYPGTMMYHPHHHGSSGDQFFTMHGAIVIEPPNPEFLDPFLRSIDFKVVILQHMYCEVSDWNDDVIAHSLGDLELLGDSQLQYDLANHSDLFGVNSSEFNVHVNGLFLPVMGVTQNEWFGLRLIGAMPIYMLFIVFDETCEVVIVARDGVYLNQALSERIIVLASAQRVDVAVKCSEPGFFAVTNVVSETMDWLCEPENYLHCLQEEFTMWFIEVTASDDEGEDFPLDWTAPLRPYYLQDLARIPYEQLNGTFEIVGDTKLRINYKLFTTEFDYLYGQSLHPHGIYEFNLTMDDTDNAAAHPLHFHVNHFQIVAETIRNPDGDYTGSDSGNITALYKVGEFRDTVMVFTNRILTIRFSTFGFTGTLALHCHFLHHSDLGMLATFAVSDLVDDQPAQEVPEQV